MKVRRNIMAKSKLDKMMEQVESATKTKAKIKFIQKNTDKISDALCDLLDEFSESAAQNKIDSFIADIKHVVDMKKHPNKVDGSSSSASKNPTENVAPTVATSAPAAQ